MPTSGWEYKLDLEIVEVHQLLEVLEDHPGLERLKLRLLDMVEHHNERRMRDTLDCV